MVLGLIWLVLSLGLSGLIYYFSGLYQVWYYFFVPIVSVPLLYLLLFGLYVLVVWLASLFMDKTKINEKPDHFALWLIRQTCIQILFLFGVRVHVSGKEKLPSSGNVVIVSNHLSDFDQFCILMAFPEFPMIWVSKPENFDIPIAGGWIARAGYLPINREDPIEGVRTIRKAAAIAEKGLASVGISPEGTRSRDHHLHDFKPGAFRVATLSKRPLVTVALQNTWKIPHNLFRRITNVYLDVLEVDDYEKIKDENTVALAERIHNLIAEKLAEDKVH